MTRLAVEQLGSRLLPDASSLFTAVNEEWRVLGVMRQPMQGLAYNLTLTPIAQAWANDMAGLGGDGRDVGAQNEVIDGWWSGSSAVEGGDETLAARQLVTRGTLVYGTPQIQAGVGQATATDGTVVNVLITGVYVSELGTMPPAGKKGTI